MTDSPKKRGRPPRKPLSPDYDLVQTLAAQGMTKEQLALSIGMSHDTYTRREKEDEELFLAFARGKSEGIRKVSGALFSKAVGGDTVSMLFYLKAMAGWRDTAAVELSGKNGGPVEVNDVKTQLAQKLLKMGGASGSEGNASEDAEGKAS